MADLNNKVLLVGGGSWLFAAQAQLAQVRLLRLSGVADLVKSLAGKSLASTRDATSKGQQYA